MSAALNPMTNVMRRELSGYFQTPVAWVFIVIFLVMAAVFTFYIGNFYERGSSDLDPFFQFHPWLYLFLVPAIAMRLWAEERRAGTIELLLTLPLTTWQAVLGKFLAAWFFIGLALLLTFPVWLTVNYLGNPDNGVIVAGYIGSWLMAGGFLAIGSCMSAITRNQVVAAPVIIDRETLKKNRRQICAVIANSGNANAFTGGGVSTFLRPTGRSGCVRTKVTSISSACISVSRISFA